MLQKISTYFLCSLLLLMLSCKKDPAKNALALIDKDGYSFLTLTASDMATKRGAQDGEGWTITKNMSAGAFLISPVLDQLGAGSGRVGLSVKIPDNSSLAELVATIRSQRY
jgi:hypothetical protein